MSVDSLNTNHESEEFIKLKKSLFRVLLNKEVIDFEYLDTNTTNADDTRQSYKSISLISKRNNTASVGLRVRKAPLIKNTNRGMNSSF